jgi:hypothetical protein
MVGLLRGVVEPPNQLREKLAVRGGEDDPDGTRTATAEASGSGIGSVAHALRYFEHMFPSLAVDQVVVVEDS